MRYQSEMPLKMRITSTFCSRACARTAMSLPQLGTECAGLFSWFEAFQTRLTKHVNRVCREAVEKSTTP